MNTNIFLKYLMIWLIGMALIACTGGLVVAMDEIIATGTTKGIGLKVANYYSEVFGYE